MIFSAAYAALKRVKRVHPALPPLVRLSVCLSVRVPGALPVRGRAFPDGGSGGKCDVMIMAARCSAGGAQSASKHNSINHRARFPAVRSFHRHNKRYK